MNERLVLLRNTLKLTGAKFGERIGIKKSTVSGLENGTANLTDRMLKSICREFNVNEEWLRNGTGEMFNKETTFSLDDYAKNNNLTDIEKKLIVGFMGLDPEIREAVYSVFENAFSTTNRQSNVYDEAPDTPEELERIYPPIEPIEPIDINKFNSRTG